MKSIGFSAALFGALLMEAPFALSGEGLANTGNLSSPPLLLAAHVDQFSFSVANLNGAAGLSIFRQAMITAIKRSIALTGTGPWTESYEYDAAGRLKKVTFADGAISNYTLDNAGNRTNVATTVP